MKTLVRLVWNDPGVCLGLLGAVAQLALFLPDWKAGLTAALTAGAGIARGLSQKPS